MGRSRVNQIRRHFETNESGNGTESRERRERKKERKRQREREKEISLFVVHAVPLTPPSSSFSSLASPPISFASSEISKAFPSYFPLFLLFVLLSRFLDPIPSISSHRLHPGSAFCPVCILFSTCKQ